jgi:Mce-associated membrane protein
MAEHADIAGRSVSGSTLAEGPSAVADYERGGADKHGFDEAVGANAETHVQKRVSRVRSVIAVSVAAAVALACLAGWLGYRTEETRQAQARINLFVEAARQGAINLTTFSYAETDADIKRILDSTTGSFHDDFKKGSAPFAAVIKQAKSKSEGTVMAAGMESQDGDQAQVLVSVSVKTSNAGALEQEPRAWRMRIGLQKVDYGAKVSAVTFVP